MTNAFRNDSPGYITRRQTPTITEKKVRKALAVASINRELQVLRRLLNLAVEWGRIESAPKIRMLSGENHCEFVVSPTEEAKYLLSAPQLLSEVATVLVDSGLRPEEAYRLRWETVTWANGKHGTFLVTHGKTKAARRVLPMTARVRGILEARWKAAKEPLEGWVCPQKPRAAILSRAPLRSSIARR
jgi:integrase